MKASMLRYSALLIALLLLVTGCTPHPPRSAQKEAVEDRLRVYASIFPLYDFARNIGRDKIQLELLIPPGAEPHSWEPPPKLVARIQEADVFIYNGAGLEPWVDKLRESLTNSGLLVVNASEGIRLLDLQGQEHDAKEGSHHHGSKFDPHVWLDPVNALKQAEAIKNAFIERDEANSQFYRENFEKYAARLTELDRIYREELRDLKRKEIVVAHAAFGYLARRYGLKQIPIAGLSPQEEPSAAKLAEIAEIAREKGIKYIFFETLTNPRLSEVLAREVGARTAALNPIGGITREEMASGRDYISIMEENLRILKEALGE